MRREKPHVIRRREKPRVVCVVFFLASKRTSSSKIARRRLLGEDKMQEKLVCFVCIALRARTQRGHKVGEPRAHEERECV